MENENNVVSTVNADIPGEEEKNDRVKIRTAEDLADWLEQFGEKPIRHQYISNADEEVYFEGLLDSASDDLLLKIIDYHEDPNDEVFETINSICCFVELQFAEYVEIMRSIYYVKEALHELLSIKLSENSRISEVALADCINKLENELSFYFYDF